MSRCFPYPPPGYTVNRRSNEALIESIKLQKEREQQQEADRKKEKKEKKEKKREKKEKKKEKKEKSKKNADPLSYDKKINEVEKSWADLPEKKLREDENEHLERSNVTEEHEKPVASQNPSTSSESTENSSKRKRHSLSPAIVKQEEHATRGNGNVLRLRLSSQKNKEAETSVSQEQPCSTSGRVDLPLQRTPQIGPGVDLPLQRKPQIGPGVDLPLQRKPQIAPGVDLPLQRKPQIVPGVDLPLQRKPQIVPGVDLPSQRKPQIVPGVDLPPQHKPQIVPRVVQETLYPPLLAINSASQARPPRPDKELICSTSGRTESLIKEDTRTAPGIKLPEKKIKLSRGELKYKSLIENWIPPPLQTEMEVDDEDDWLLPKKNPLNHVEKKLKTSNDNIISSSCSSSSNLWPRAQFLPEADIYMLPYTVPF